ncbi:MAG TPA: CpXC domain-containing protein, partial [Anaerolineaceae bacterium]|nr:CpXC domain-containing protein [Anaerolineaceae bacterium]
MAKTTVNCPNCRQPMTIELTRLFDMNTDPQAKQKLLSGSANYYQCPTCHNQGVYPTPLIYHDPDKELLLTYFPPELNVPLPQQEQTFGPLIKKVVDDLKPEKRKGYIFNPQSMLTQQRLFERILEADGITPEMMKAQQEKLKLIQTFLQAKADVLPEMVVQNDTKIDEEFFTLLAGLTQASAAQGDEQGVKALTSLQKVLLERSTLGRQAAAEAAATRDAMQELQDLSKAGLTREKLLDLLQKNASNETKLTAQATIARGALDYQFFQTLSERIDATSVEQRAELTALREKLLTITEQVDAALKAQAEQAQALLDEL